MKTSLKRIFRFIAIALPLWGMGSFAFADDFNLYYDTTAGETDKKLESVTNLQKLTFKDGQMMVVRTDGTTSILTISNIKRLFFSTAEGLTPIKDVKAEDIIDLKKGDVYDLMGRKLNIDLSKEKLPKGIYIKDGKKIFVK